MSGVGSGAGSVRRRRAAGGARSARRRVGQTSRQVSSPRWCRDDGRGRVVERRRGTARPRAGTQHDEVGRRPGGDEQLLAEPGSRVESSTRRRAAAAARAYGHRPPGRRRPGTASRDPERRAREVAGERRLGDGAVGRQQPASSPCERTAWRRRAARRCAHAAPYASRPTTPLTVGRAHVRIAQPHEQGPSWRAAGSPPRPPAAVRAGPMTGGRRSPCPGRRGGSAGRRGPAPARPSAASTSRRDEKRKTAFPVARLALLATTTHCLWRARRLVDRASGSST
jgi:hypothetical protein